MSRRPEGHFHPHFSQQVVERPAPAKRDGSVRPGLHGEASTSNIQLYMIYSWMHRLGETPKKLKFIYIYNILLYITTFLYGNEVNIQNPLFMFGHETNGVMFFFFFFGFRCEDLRLRLRDPFEDAPEVTPGSGWEWGEGVGLVALVPCGQCYEFFFSSSAVSHRCRFVWFLLMLSEIEGKEKRVQPERTRATTGEDGHIWWCQIFEEAGPTGQSDLFQPLSFIGCCFVLLAIELPTKWNMEMKAFYRAPPSLKFTRR